KGSSSWRRSPPAGRSPARTIARSPSSCARASTGPCSSRTTSGAARLRCSAASASPTACTRPPGRPHSGSRSSDARGASSGSTIDSWPRDGGGPARRGEGPGEGRNRGARKATGEVLVFVDADCVLPPNLLEAVFLALADPDVVGGATGFAPAKGRPVERSLFYLANAYQRAMTIWGIPHNAGYCFFFRKTAFESLGGIREDLVLNETHDLAIRSRSIGRFVLLPIIVEPSMRRFRTY